jgi:chromosome segregation ATPase
MGIEANQETVNTIVMSAPITIDDVRSALGETDPNSTNADRIRAILGRGSNATIQKHLNTIRAELVSPVSQTVDTPNAPKDLIQSIWSHAWQTAQAQTSGALAAAIERREQAERERDVAAADRDAAQAGQDTAAEMLAKERVSSEEKINELLHDIDEVIEERDAVKKEIETLLTAAKDDAVKAEAKLDEVKKEAALQQERAEAAAALTEAKHQAVIQNMRFEIDRLVNQLADLRSAFKTEKTHEELFRKNIELLRNAQEEQEKDSAKKESNDG